MARRRRKSKQYTFDWGLLFFAILGLVLGMAVHYRLETISPELTTLAGIVSASVVLVLLVVMKFKKSRIVWFKKGGRFAYSNTERTSLPKKLRFQILKRDNYTCQLCGATAKDGAKLEVDHKKAWVKTGRHEPDNLWTLCQPCNRGKSTEDL